ncbi:MAG: hypothetical protein EPN85_06930 [Bacteroidetes bacterium]|nr:MAG: hypothetical protein EPN85_06930 [Bacteroidota bacterium]
MAKVRKYEEKAHVTKDIELKAKYYYVAQGIEEAAEMFYYEPKTFKEQVQSNDNKNNAPI